MFFLRALPRPGCPWFVFALALASIAGPLPESHGAETKLRALDGAAGDNFGYSVSLSGDRIAVGSPWDDDQGPLSGAVYVFRLTAGVWTQEQKIVPSDGAFDDNFGSTVSLDGDVLVAGSPQANIEIEDEGAAYVFRRNGTTWTEEQKLTAADGGEQQYFGRSVSVDAGRILVGSDQDDDLGVFSGSAYVFRFNGSSWVQEQKLTANDGTANDFFGATVCIQGERAIIGSIYDDVPFLNSGSAYVFRRVGTVWTQEGKLTAGADSGAEDFFGGSVAISGVRAVVGARLEDQSGLNAGAAYVFAFNGASWRPERKLLAADGTLRDQFGTSVSIDGDVIAVGPGWTTATKTKMWAARTSFSARGPDGSRRGA